MGKVKLYLRYGCCSMFQYSVNLLGMVCNKIKHRFNTSSLFKPKNTGWDKNSVHLCGGRITHIISGVSQTVDALRLGNLQQQTFSLWQMRLVVELWDRRVLLGPANRHDALLTSEFLPVMKNMVDVALDTWLRGEGGEREISSDQVWIL